MDNTELTHWGIKGMKWGVRRFQNRDGSLTSEGRKRYGDDDDNGASKSTTPKRKSARDMTDDELIRAVNRARLEDQYNSLRPEQVSAGKKFLTSTWSNVIAPAATNAGRKFLENALNKFGDDLLKDVVDPDSVSELTKTRDKLRLKDEIDRLKNPNKHESWDDKKKRLEYERSVKDEEFVDLQRKLKTENAKKAYEKITNNESDSPKTEDKKSTETKSESSKTEDSKVYTGKVFGEGNSKGSQKNDNDWKSNNDTIYDVPFEDISNSSQTSSGRSYTNSVSNNLLPAPSSDTVSAGRSYIAGLLEPPKD